MMNNKRIFKIAKWLVIAYLIFLALYFLSDWFLSEGASKRLYYNFWNYNSDKIRAVDDNDFLFYKEGYSKTYTLNSDYYMSHRILLIPESKTVPIGYKYNGEFLIEILDNNNNLLKSTRVDTFGTILRRKESEGGDYFNNYLIYVGKEPRDAGSVFAFEIGEMPFDLIRLKWGRLKNMKIKVSIVKPENGLLEYCDTARLVIIPDLRL